MPRYSAGSRDDSSGCVFCVQGALREPQLMGPKLIRAIRSRRL